MALTFRLTMIFSANRKIPLDKIIPALEKGQRFILEEILLNEPGNKEERVRGPRWQR